MAHGCAYSIPMNMASIVRLPIVPLSTFSRVFSKKISNFICGTEACSVCPCLVVIKLEFILRLKIKRNDWLLADTCPQAANHCALFWVRDCRRPRRRHAHITIYGKYLYNQKVNDIWPWYVCVRMTEDVCFAKNLQMFIQDWHWPTLRQGHALKTDETKVIIRTRCV